MKRSTFTDNQGKKPQTKKTILRKELYASEIRYRRLFESAKDGILILDAETGKIVDVNPFLMDLLGYTKQDFTEKSIWEIGAFQDIYENKDKFFELQQEEYVRYDDLPLVTSDGREIHVEFVSNVYLANKIKVIQCNIRDITERKRAEEKLKNSEERFKILFDYAPDAYYLTDLSGTFIDGNIAAVKMLGYNKNELIGNDFFKLKLISPNQFFKATELLAKNLLGQATGPEEFVLSHKNGSKITVEIRAYPVKIQEKSIVLGIARDNTGRKQAEQEIAMLAHSLKSISECVSITDLENKILFVNESFLKTYGYELNELIGKNISIVRSKNNEQAQLEKILQATIKGEWHGELMNRKKDGTEFPVYLSTTLIKVEENKVLGLIGVASDITERKQIQQKIKESEEQFRTITENSADAIFITDKKGKYIYVNKQAVDLLGYSKEELLTFTIADVSPKNRIAEYFQFFQQLTVKGSSYSEIELVKKDGSYADTDLNAVLLPNGWIYGSCRDISKRKKLETDLIKAKVKAEENDRLKSAFLANMSHEIRTPMNGILGFAELLRTEDLTGKEKHKFIGIIEKSGARLLNLINDIISISKIESNQIEITFSDVDVNLQVKDIYNFFKLEAENKKLNIAFKNDLPANEAIIKTDGQKVYAALTNLVKNAIKFTQSGSIELGYLKKDKFLEFYVKDSGSGVLGKNKKIIFERFRQGSEALNRDYEGAGLGLSISKAYVEMLGGKIWVENNTDHNGIDSGATFFFTIPVCPPVKVNSFMPGTMKDNRSADFYKLKKNDNKFQYE